MDDIIIGSEALAAGLVTRQGLRTKYRQLYRGVYVPLELELTAVERARAAWLWSHRKATVVGLSAAALHGARWVATDAKPELAHTRGSSPPNIVIHRGAIAADEICLRQSVDCTTPARTAYDIGRRVDGDAAVARIDALLNATRCPVADVDRIARRYPGARGLRRLRATLALVDGGAESPRETRLRLLLVRSGLPRPVTQIRVGKRRVDMGWPQWLVGAEYDGEQHFTNPDDYADDIERLEFLAAQGWLIVRVSSRQLEYQRAEVVRRVREALVSRGCPLV